MQLPLLQLLGLATGAVGIAQKAFAQGNSKGNFDAELTSAMEGKTDVKNLVSELLAKKGGIDDQAFQSLLTVPTGVLMFQFMAALRQMGVQASDIQLLLTGNGAQISDDSLKALLSQLGIGQKDLDAILADPQAMSDIKAQLADSFKAIIDEQALKDGVDPDALRELVASDSQTMDEVINRLESGNQFTQDQTGLAGESPAAEQSASSAASSGEKTAITVGLIQRNVSHTTNEIRAALAEIVRKAAISGSVATEAQAGEENVADPAGKVSKLVSVAEGTLGISRATLKDLFFETNPDLRQQAVARVTEQVNAYLKSQEGIGLSPEVEEALSFVKTAMSEQEFSGIDNSLKLLTQGQTVSDTKVPVDREMFTALSRHLNSENSTRMFDNHMKQVIDQLRQTLPSHMKNGEGQVTLRLHPPMLGRVDVSMTMQDGELQAVFRADQSITRDMLIQNINILKDALADQGIKATQFTVSTTFDNRSPHNGFAFASQERQSHGFGHQGRGSENQGRTFREEEGTVYQQANYSGLGEGSLDLFA